MVPAQVMPAFGLRRDHRYRTKPDKSGAGPIISIQVVEVISVVIAATEFKGFGPSSNHAEIGAESFGIVVCRFVTEPCILGLVWPIFRLESGSKSKISRRILKS